jgi:hypothetical protein
MCLHQNPVKGLGPVPGARHAAQSANMPQGDPAEPISKPSGSVEYHCRESGLALPDRAKRSVSRARSLRSLDRISTGMCHPMSTAYAREAGTGLPRTYRVLPGLGGDQ